MEIVAHICATVDSQLNFRNLPSSFSENKNTADLFLDSSFPCGDSWEHPNSVISHGALTEQIWWALDWLGCPACHLIRTKPVSCSDSTSHSLVLLVVVPKMKEQFTFVLPQKQTPELPNILMLGSKFKKKEWSTNTANITNWLNCDLLVGCRMDHILLLFL